MKTQSAPSSLSTNENEYQNILKRLTANDPSFVHLDLSTFPLTLEQLREVASKMQGNSFVGNVTWGGYPSSAKEAVYKIENKIIQNNLQYKYYPSDFIHGLFSSHVYLDTKNNDKVIFKNDKVLEQHNKYLGNWLVHKIFNDDKASGYYGAIYINESTKQMILAHRGTKLDKWDLFKSDSALQTEIKGVFGGQIVAQQVTSYVVTKEATEYTKDNNYHLSITGHSLGAWLAELSLYFCHRDFNYTKVKAVTFDSPGSVLSMDKLKSNILNHETKFEVENLNITTYLAEPNFINSCNQHVGRVYRLFPEISRPETVNKVVEKLAWVKKIPKLADKLRENSFLLDGLLSIIGNNLTSLLEEFNPDTGIAVDYEKVLDWPAIKYTPNLMETKEEDKSFIKGLLNVIPYSNMVPDFLKSAASSVIYSAIPDNALTNLLNILVELVNGNIISDQYFTTHKYLENADNKDGYNVELNLSNRQEFSLSY